MNDVEIRTIDISAIKELAKQTKGEIKIDGIKITKTKSIRVRS